MSNNKISEKKDRLYNIDFIRIILILFIVYYHFIAMLWMQNSELFNNLYAYSRHIGLICNSIFFIISGYFLYPALKKDINILDFIKKKLIRFWPTMFFAVICCGILALFNWIKFDVDGNLLLLLMIHKNGSGLSTSFANLNTCWFVCWLFWVLIFYFVLYKIINNSYKFNFIVAILCYIFFLIFINNGGTFAADFELIFSILPRAGILGICMVGIGILMHELINNLKIRLNCFFSTILEIGLIGYFIYNFLKGPLKEEFLLVIAASIILLYLFIQKAGLISQLLNNKYLAFFGKFAFSVYIMQEISFIILQHTLWKHINPNFVLFTIIISILLTLILGILTYYLVENPIQRYFQNKN